MQIININLIDSIKKDKRKKDMPVEILNQLKTISINEKGKELNFDRLTLKSIDFNFKKKEESDYLLFEKSKEFIEMNSKTFFIGNNHAISYPIAMAFGKVVENPFLIVFDAHADCLTNQDSPFNRRWLNQLVKGDFFGSNILLISARSLSSAEVEFIKQKRITLISMEVLEEDLQGVCDLVMERARKAEGFFLSIDLDCIDPAFAPGATELEPGGLSSRDLIYFIKRLSLLPNFRGATISEIDLDKDLNQITVKLGAKLLAEMI